MRRCTGWPSSAAARSPICTRPGIGAAWFIVRKPRGLVAAAIQYGHVKIKMTLGYAGSYASGFPDELAFEQWLDRIGTLADAHQHLAEGEHVSGPAAAEYAARVTAQPGSPAVSPAPAGKQ
jgi:hypothetical protein